MERKQHMVKIQIGLAPSTLPATRGVVGGGSRPIADAQAAFLGGRIQELLKSSFGASEFVVVRLAAASAGFDVKVQVGVSAQFLEAQVQLLMELVEEAFDALLQERAKDPYVVQICDRNFGKPTLLTSVVSTPERAARMYEKK